MTLQAIREWMGRRPFLPFRLATSDRSTFEVRHPDLARLTRTSIYIAIDVEDGIPADLRIRSLPDITAIEPLDAPDPGPGSNGPA